MLMKSGNGISLHASYGEKKKTVDVYSPELNTKYTKAPEHGTDSVPDYIVDTGMNCTAENAIACQEVCAKEADTTDLQSLTELVVMTLLCSHLKMWSRHNFTTM